jgi:hypothetical protein
MPNEVLQHYADAVRSSGAAPADRFDAWLLTLARRSPGRTALADCYARHARPYGQVRRRLTLMLALLETHGATHAHYDSAAPASMLRTWLMLALAGAGWMLRSLAATAVCLPAHLRLRGADPS